MSKSESKNSESKKPAEDAKTKWRRRARKLVFTWPGRIILFLVVAIVALRIAAPYLIKNYLNDELAALDGYHGHIEDVDLSLWYGAYHVDGLRVDKTDAQIPVKFASFSTLRIMLQWSALLDGAIVSEIDIWDLEVNFVNGETEETTQTGEGADWRELVGDLLPIDINRFELHRAMLHYRDFQSDPPVNLYLGQLHATVRNLSNSKDKSAERPATLEATARFMNRAPFEMEATIDPFSDNLDFDMTAQIENLPLPVLNPFLQAYANVDAEEGRFSFYADIESDDGRLSGWVKPIIDDADFLTWSEEDEPFFGRLYEALFGAAVEILENQPHGRTAMRIPLRGRIDDPDVPIWPVIGSFLRNAFIEALRHGFFGGGS